MPHMALKNWKSGAFWVEKRFEFSFQNKNSDYETKVKYLRSQEFKNLTHKGHFEMSFIQINDVLV